MPKTTRSTLPSEFPADGARRALLRFLAASPLFAGGLAVRDVFGQGADLASAAAALDVFDFEAAARRVVPPAHWGYLASGVDGEDTLRANRTGYARYQLRPRRFVDVSHMDLSTELFGTKLNSPVVLCPIGSLRAFHPEGELGVARAAKTKGQLQMLSTVTSTSIEDVTRERGAPVWLQLYTTNNFAATAKLVKRAEAAGSPAIAVTVDLPAGRNTVTAARQRLLDTRVCGGCHTVGATGNPQPNMAAKPMFSGIDTQGLQQTSPSLTWDFIKRLKDLTPMKVVIKGLEAGEDAMLAVEHGADGIIVSNHGGRAMESGRGTIESLSEVVQGAAGRIPVLLDGGVRRGTDVYKALALGASAVGIGRPYVWGLATFGAQGVERVLDIVNMELRLAMVGCGARTVKEISRSSVIDTVHT
ncbi:MAG TPA: alpha-hydroxy acid oxidase [Steroidobacteraceae bacterium]|jgi:isopentenyl diphosphate isomerase/L-lactate dehydrogenase-like FMN-dependent dehydrogenase|nr:alpha-hydroxy acid oxidase [Steroidobacteraceae bacterium]